MVRRPVADAPGVWRACAGESSFPERQVGVQIGLRGLGPSVAKERCSAPGGDLRAQVSRETSGTITGRVLDGLAER